MSTPNPIEVQKHLGGLDYPATKEEIVNKAKSEGASGEIVDALSGIEDKQYDAPTAINQAIS